MINANVSEGGIFLLPSVVPILSKRKEDPYATDTRTISMRRAFHICVAPCANNETFDTRNIGITIIIVSTTTNDITIRVTITIINNGNYKITTLTGYSANCNGIARHTN